MLNKRTGQSTVEYIVLVSAVIAVAVVFFLSDNSVFKTQMNTTYGTVSGQITDMQNRLHTAEAAADAAASPGAIFNTDVGIKVCEGNQKRNPTTGLCEPW